MKTKVTTVRIPAEVYEQAKAKARKEHLSFNTLIRRLVDAYVNDGTDKEDSPREIRKQ
jgi:predicted HicB family RNase H-like nuclease